MKTPPSFSSPPEASSLLRWPLIVLCLLALLYHMEATSTLALVPVFTGEFQLADIQAAIVSNAAVLFSALLSIPLGLYADVYRRTRIPLLAAGLCVWAGVTGIRGIAQGFLSLTLLATPSGISIASSTAPGSGLIYDSYPPRLRSQALGILSAGQALGTLAGFLLPGLLITVWNWRLLYAGFAAIGFFLFLLPLLRMREPAVMPTKELPRSPVPTIRRNFREGTRHILRSRGALVGIAGLSAQAFGVGGIGTFLAPYFVRYFATTSSTADNLVAVVVLALVLGSVLGGFVDAALGRRLGNRSHALVAGGATLLLGILFAVALAIPSLLIFLALSTTCGLLLGMTTAPLLALIGEMVESDHRNYAYALQVAVVSLCQAAGGVVTGDLSDQFHSLQLAFLLFAAVLLFVGIGIASQSQNVIHRSVVETDTSHYGLVPSAVEPFPIISFLPAPVSTSKSVALLPLALPSLPITAPGKRILAAPSLQHLPEEGQENELARRIEVEAQAWEVETSVWFDSPDGLHILVHSQPDQSGWLFSRLLPEVGMYSVLIPSRLAGIRLALHEITQRVQENPEAFLSCSVS